MHVRDATSEDCAALVRLTRQAEEETQHDLPPIDGEKSFLVFERLIEFAGTERVFAKVIAEEEGGLGGMLIGERVPSMWFDSDLVCSHHIYVTPRLRGSLVAGRMLAAFMKWARAEPCLIRLDATSGMGGADAGTVFTKLGLHKAGDVYSARVV